MSIHIALIFPFPLACLNRVSYAEAIYSVAECPHL